MTTVLDKKDQLKRLFYSNLTSIELQRKLDLTNNEYQQLLQEVKHDLGLPSSYRRTPHRYGKYVKDAYFIKKYDQNNNDFEVITYAPTIEDIENKQRLLDDGISLYVIEQATDENMNKLIKEDYFQKKLLWSDILRKYQIPYLKFYELLGEIKKELGIKDDVRTVKSTRYIYKYNRTGKYLIKKNVDGKSKGFGYYSTVDVAVKVRDYLESIHWNVTKWQKEKSKVVEQAQNGC